MATNNAINSSNPIQVAKGGTGLASATAYAVLCGGTTSTGPHQSIAGLGSSGNVLTSNGAGALPTFQASSSTPVTLQLATVTLTSAQIKSLHATPITIIAAPGSGNVIVPVSFSMFFTYGGSNVFVAGVAQTISFRFNGSSVDVGIICTNAILVGTASAAYGFTVVASSTALQNTTNAALNLNNSSSTEISGNAANDNTCEVRVLYYISSP